MKKEFEGIVIEIQDNEIAKIKMARHGDCANCGSCAGDGAVLIETDNKFGAKLGQRVLVETTNDSMLRSAFVVFIMPLFCSIISAYIGYLLHSIIMISETFSQIIFGSAGFLISVLYIRHYDKAEKGKSKMPRIIQILN